MLCKNPYIRMPDPKDPKKYKIIKAEGAARLAKEVFPCGQCLNCRINKARSWTNRLILELLDHGKATFVTLTYSDDNLPDNGTLVPLHVTNFLKRLRATFEYQDEKRADACILPDFRTVRYYYCGEYGENFGRPHYHLALFGICQTETDLIERCWRLGNVFMGDLNKNSIGYCAGYILKGMTNDKSEYNQEYLDGRHPEFQRMSRRPAIGSEAIKRIAFKSKSDERFTEIRQGVHKVLLGRTLQRYADEVIGYENDGTEANDFWNELYETVDPKGDYKEELVKTFEQHRLIQKKRYNLYNRRKKL